MKKQIVGIIGGKGKMGQFFARFFEKNGFQVIISDTQTKLSNVDVAQQADIVLISVPMDVIEDVIAQVGPHVRKESLLMDVNAIKGPIMKKMLECSESSVLGCHPMFAPVNHLEGQVCIFCEGRGVKWQQVVTDLLLQNGAEVRFLDPKKHDELMTIIQGLMHFVDITTTKTLKNTGIPIEKLFDFRSPAYRLKLDMMGRILYQDPGLYGNIQMQNPRTPDIIKKFLENAKEFLNITEKKDFQKFNAFWKEAREYLGDFAAVCQKESDDIIDFLSAASVASEDIWYTKEQKGELGVLGPENTFSHLAAQKFFPHEKSIVFFRSIPEIFEAFERKKVQSILVPVENKLHGSVRETLDSLFHCSETIQGMFRMPIHFVLAGLPGSQIDTIHTISSHAQPLAQCSEFLQNNFSEASLIPVSSTSIAILEILKSKNPHHALICSKEAAENSGLQIFAEGIENSNKNETWFAFLSHQEHRFSGQKSFVRSSAVFYFDQDSPGSLASVLEEFSNANVNLTKIESRPAGHIFGDYLFFLDFEGTVYNDTVQTVFTKVEQKVAKLKTLGSYPVISKI